MCRSLNYTVELWPLISNASHQRSPRTNYTWLLSWSTLPSCYLVPTSRQLTSKLSSYPLSRWILMLRSNCRIYSSRIQSHSSSNATAYYKYSAQLSSNLLCCCLTSRLTYCCCCLLMAKVVSQAEASLVTPCFPPPSSPQSPPSRLREAKSCSPSCSPPPRFWPRCCCSPLPTRSGQSSSLQWKGSRRTWRRLSFEPIDSSPMRELPARLSGMRGNTSSPRWTHTYPATHPTLHQLSSLIEPPSRREFPML